MQLSAACLISDQDMLLACTKPPVFTGMPRPFHWGCHTNSGFPACMYAQDCSAPDTDLCFSLNWISEVFMCMSCIFLCYLSHCTLTREVEIQQSLKPLAFSL